MTGRTGVRLEIYNDGVRHALEQYVAALSDFVLRRDEDTGLPQLLVLELDATDPDETFARIRAVQQSSPSIEIFITSARMDPQLLLEVLRAGVKEFLTQPLRPDEVQQAFQRFRERHAEVGSVDARRNGKIVSVVGGKAGVGATTLVASLAAGLKINGAAVGVLDLNLRGGDVPAFFDLNPIRSLRDVDLDLSRLDYAFLGEMLTKHSSGLDVLPLGDSELSGTSISSECVDRTLRIMRTMFDFVVVDCGHNIDMASYAALSLSQYVLLVATLTVPVVRRSKRLLDALRGEEGSGLDPSVINLVVNRYNDRDELILTEARKVLGLKAQWLLPHDHEAAGDALNGGQPVIAHAPRSPLSKAIQKIAVELHAPSTGSQKSSFLSGMFRSVSDRITKPTPSVA
ncbi:MAG TPA: P-loop NTPase [Candidatus Binatia bacterium]|jgi:pilus assembly protein CpaE